MWPRVRVIVTFGMFHLVRQLEIIKPQIDIASLPLTSTIKVHTRHLALTDRPHTCTRTAHFPLIPVYRFSPAVYSMVPP